MVHHRDHERCEANAISGQRYAIRPYDADDLDSLYRICLATGQNGQDASNLYADPDLIGHIYAGPYGRFSPECCFVVEDDAGVGGYILGAFDTAAFESLLETVWWPTLRPRYLDPSTRPRSEWSLDEIRAWQIHHPIVTPARLTEPYPSHLHIDILPRLQRQGVGRALMNRWLAHMRASGSRGAHLGVGSVNEGAVRFYHANGWRELPAPGPSSARTVWFAIEL
ncbi:MAG TPA: GNAT family N-acetyltransferase [Caulobacteraceae bacterium]